MKFSDFCFLQFFTSCSIAQSPANSRVENVENLKRDTKQISNVKMIGKYEKHQ